MFWVFRLQAHRLPLLEQSKRENLLSFEEALKEHVLSAPVKHVDETGYRIAGQTQWLHVLSTQTATWYEPSAYRKRILEGLEGILVHDGWKSYFKQPGVIHALCNAHHLRELRALKEIEKEPWAKQMYRLLKLGHQIKHSYLDGVVPPQKSEKFKQCFCKILERGITYHEAMKPLEQLRRGRPPRRVGHNLLIRLINHSNAVLLFLANPLVPFTNNQAEQDIRMMKGKQKVSGGFRTSNGAITFCRNRSFLSTMRKKGENIINSIADVFSHRKTIWNFS